MFSPPTIRSSFSPFSLQLLLIFSFSLLSPSIGAFGNQFKSDGSVLELDDSNFDAAISKFDFIFVDFYAPWCGHCNRLAPELERAARVLAGLRQPIVVTKEDADKYKKLASLSMIWSKLQCGYPTLKSLRASKYLSGGAVMEVVSKFVIASLLMWTLPIAVLYGFNHNVFPGSAQLSAESLTLWSGILAVISVNVVIVLYIISAMKEPSDKHEPDPRFLADAKASIKQTGPTEVDSSSSDSSKQE